MIAIKRTNYHGWENSFRLTNEAIELVVTTDVGPRIIYFGLKNADNEFANYHDLLGRHLDAEWNIYGGHRFWHAPEHPSRTYHPDNVPIILEEHDGFIRLIQETETTTGIQKELDITLDPEIAHVKVKHRLVNHNLWPVELAPWALSVMAPGGVGIIPLPPRGTHPEALLPANTLTMWPYSDMSDPRWTWGRQFILLQQDPKAATPQKIGLANHEGWIAYARRGHLFVKTFTPDREARYPDFNSTVELFTNQDMLELETLGPLVKLQPGSVVTHTEYWWLFANIAQPNSEVAVQEKIVPLIKTIV
jgi:hypothetical protein